VTQHLIDLVRVQFAGTVAIDGFADPSDEFGQLGRVVLPNGFACRPPF
jgi:hypothetical protein